MQYFVYDRITITKDKTAWVADTIVQRSWVDSFLLWYMEPFKNSTLQTVEALLHEAAAEHG